MNDTNHNIVEYSEGNVHFGGIFLPRFRNLLYTIQARDTIYIPREHVWPAGGRKKNWRILYYVP